MGLVGPDLLGFVQSLTQTPGQNSHDVGPHPNHKDRYSYRLLEYDFDWCVTTFIPFRLHGN